MNPHEEPLVFECAGEALVGILSLPATYVRTAVVIVVGGPQYRAGSHRQFVSLARCLAAGGIAALRFDHRGIGDSAGRQRPFDSIDCACENSLRQNVNNLPRALSRGLSRSLAKEISNTHAHKLVENYRPRDVR